MKIRTVGRWIALVIFGLVLLVAGTIFGFLLGTAESDVRGYAHFHERDIHVFYEGTTGDSSTDEKVEDFVRGYLLMLQGILVSPEPIRSSELNWLAYQNKLIVEQLIQYRQGMQSGEQGF